MMQDTAWAPGGDYIAVLRVWAMSVVWVLPFSQLPYTAWCNPEGEQPHPTCDGTSREGPVLPPDPAVATHLILIGPIYIFIETTLLIKTGKLSSHEVKDSLMILMEIILPRNVLIESTPSPTLLGPITRLLTP